MLRAIRASVSGGRFPYQCTCTPSLAQWVVLACGALQFRRPGSTVQAVEGFDDDKQPSASEVSDGSAESRCLIREKVLWLRMQVVKKMWSEVA